MLVILNAAEGVLDLVAGESDIDCAQCWRAPTRGTEILAPALDGMLRGLERRPGDVRRWACVRGPGSFTGVRLVLSTVAAIRRVTGAEVAALDYMQALACAGQRVSSPSSPYGRAYGGHRDSSTVAGPTGWIWTITHARRDLVHCQNFERQDSGIPRPLSDVDLCSPEEAAQRMSLSPAGSVMLGSGVVRNANALGSCFRHVQSLRETVPQARDLWLLAQEASYDAADIEPLYVRPCDAVDNLSHIAEKQGMEPDLAHARLTQLLNTPPAAAG